ncbi:glutamine amidotransferase [Enterococcus sp. ALS3]|uniref:Glutamine amidotransferase n=1 Tax=Enterococcus alishanensis TaxID=1303817 RepID=A0ABS6TC96_9ENTE|nr:type 1 glutamine amidotransferase family protein [Enterococcus alishanensis]MBV7390506.1 glutamine amidotransferase [Enterococcus alishanensis]
MRTIYVYLLDTLADWELGHITAELNSKRFFKKDAAEITIKTVSYNKESIRTMGGMRITPDCSIEDVVVEEKNLLLLPGADTWGDGKHQAIIEKANRFLSEGAGVAAICGATVPLANFGMLDHRLHTSNGSGFLEMFCLNYQGSKNYVDQPAVSADNLITASATGNLLWTKEIIAYLEVFELDTLTAWYNYFETGEAGFFYQLMESLPEKEIN